MEYTDVKLIKIETREVIARDSGEGGVKGNEMLAEKYSFSYKLNKFWGI